MIAVCAKEAERPIVAEFFELFKTPWVFYQENDAADVVICSSVGVPKTNAKLVVVYGAEAGSFDKQRETRPLAQGPDGMLVYRGERIPIYGDSLAFGESAEAGLKHELSGAAAAVKAQANDQTVVRIGYDLFKEVTFLLTRGQPETHASIPALEWHITILRELIIGASVPLVEIPPVPAGHQFVACLTHDVDHVGIRSHRFDHTLFGFIYRATIGSIREVVTGRKTVSQLVLNWLAVLKLPLVHLGLVGDFWYQFDHYVKLENGVTSTFFVIPKQGETGLDAKGNRPARRAASYDAADLEEHLEKLKSAGKEIGVHGIDAWRDADAGREEHGILSQLTGAPIPGVRMHWLFFGEQSHATLEQAGFGYDSTVGYNGAIGYRAGTTQVFKPLTVSRLLELPMHIMDTALFYPSHLNLSPGEAKCAMRPLIANAVRFGGALTVNWHDRSIAPERLWDGSYVWLIESLKAENAWFATASQSVVWFKKRRMAVFQQTGSSVKIKATAAGEEFLPALQVRVYRPGVTKREEMDLPDAAELSLAF